VLTPHPSLERVWVLSRDGAPAEPRVTVVAGLHGNEPCGVRALEAIVDAPDAFASRMLRGTLTLVVGNPRALEQGQRFTRGGTDLNRLFSYRFLETVPEARWCYEERRALELRGVMTEADAMLDLHSATAPTPPFAICARKASAAALAAKLGCRVVYGWEPPDLDLAEVSIGSLATAGRPAVAVECGQHEDPDAVTTARLVIERFLGAIGVTDHAVSDAGQPHFRLVSRVRRPNPKFRLASAFAGFTRLEPGEMVALDGLVSLRVERAAYAILPTPSAEVGNDLVLLARLSEAGDLDDSQAPPAPPVPAPPAPAPPAPPVPVPPAPPAPGSIE
jgi:succinylglutamate desuccinylase